MPDTSPRPSRVRAIAQAALGLFLVTAGTGHMTFQREEFQAQVPPWVPVDPDVVVLASGVVELALGGALLTARKQPRRAIVGATTAAFFVAVFPGNIAQYTGQVDAFGLDSDLKRALRLPFQPVLIAWALASTEALRTLRSGARDD
ncbi:MAG: DoxX family protein [Solirubrobacteraceae bacterium]